MKEQKMNAIICTEYGAAEVLQIQKVEMPSPNDNEVLVKIYAASITRAETMMRTGYPLIGRLFMGLTKPKNQIPGTGFAGKVEAVGEKVTQFKKGDAVFGESLDTFGTYAEYVCISEMGIIVTKPENISYEEAAVVGDGLITSLNFLKELANIQSGQKVLINGASGSLGTAAVQLAKHFRTEVTGVCSTNNLELVKSLGADTVIDYTTTDFTKSGQSYDVIYDTVGKSSFSRCKSSLTQKGIYMSPVLSLPLLFQIIRSMFGTKKAMFSATGTLPLAKVRGFLHEIKELIVKKKVKSIIDKRFLLEQAVEAHRYVDQGHKKGNVVFQLLA